MNWPAEKPLTLPPAGTLLSDATPGQCEAVQEDLARWRLANGWSRQIKAGEISKADVWRDLKEKPEAYRDDMVRRLKEVANA